MPSSSVPSDISVHAGGGVEACCITCREEISIPFQYQSRVLARLLEGDTPPNCLILEPDPSGNQVPDSRPVFRFKKRCALLAFYWGRENIG